MSTDQPGLMVHVLLVSEKGEIPLVKETTFATPYWKFPGGKSSKYEDHSIGALGVEKVAIVTGLRELFEETGIIITDDLKPRFQVLRSFLDPRGFNDIYLRILVTHLPPHIPRSLDEEIVKIFSLSEIPKMEDFLRPQYTAAGPCIEEMLDSPPWVH